MGMRYWGLAVLAGVFCWSVISSAEISKTCEDNKECLIELPGSTCADGTSSFMTLTRRPNAQHLLVYLTGGGACWSADSCKKGLASVLTRQETPTDWNEGDGVGNAKDAANPFGSNYSVVTVPYCTGDAHVGARTIDYGTASSPYVIRHQGYKNVQLAFDKVKSLFPTPQKVVLLGCSAGGIGAYYHMRTLANEYPNAEKFVVSDAGTPFRPPYVKADAYKTVMLNWGADQTLPAGQTDFSSLVAYNTKTYPDIRFGFISSYQDKVMTFFALAVGSTSPFTAVRDTIISLSDQYIGKDTTNAKVFYTNTSRHCHTVETLETVTSVDANLGTWLTDMVTDKKGWENERPDLSQEIFINPNQALPTIRDVRSHL